MSVDRKAWGWCPSVLRPMPLDDGLMVRIRVPGGALSPEQAAGLARAADRYGARVITPTNRGNLQLRGLTEVEHAALVPELDEIGLTAIDHTPSGRVNITQSPFRDARAEAIAKALADHLARAEFKALPQKFGFVVDTDAVRVLGDVSGDIRIEAAGEACIVRASGAETGVRTDDPVAVALDLARWFLGSGLIGADGRGRMAEHVSQVPQHFRGTLAPNHAISMRPVGRLWITAEQGHFQPRVLLEAVDRGVGRIFVSPFYALYLPDLAPDGADDNKAETASRGDGVNAV